MNENQHNAVRLAAILEEDDAPIPPNTNGKANGHAAICTWCNKNPQSHGEMCDSCWTYSQTGVKPKSEVTSRDTGGNFASAETVRQATKCRKRSCGNPAQTGSNYCTDCYQKLPRQSRIEDKNRNKPHCKTCGKYPIFDIEGGGTECRECINHAPTREKKGTKLEFPESCMYGWCGDFARKMGAPLSAAYPAVLAVAASYGVPNDPRVRSTLYVTIVGDTRSGKSVTKDRVLNSWAAPPETKVVKGYPGSEQGLILLLDGKKAKDMKPEDFYPKPYLLVQDEMRMMFGKIAIQNSGLPHALNELFYEDQFGTAVKGQGHLVCAPRLCMLGCLTCANPDQFAEVYGVDTATGLYGRTVFGWVPKGWDFQFETWEMPGEVDGYRRPKTCRVGAEAFLMAKKWAEERPGERIDLKELALRVALVTASMNHDDEVGEECMRRALQFMEVQEKFRAKYRPAESDTPSGKCQTAIIRALEQYEDWVPWRELCRKHSLYRGKDRDATVLNRVRKAMVYEGMIEEEYYSEASGRDTKEKTGRVRLVR
jgi:hypothetical protein